MTLRIGFIGCGGIARHHANQLKEVRSARIAACADIVESAARSFAETYGAEAAYTDFRRMLRQADLDAVFVCTPTGRHKEGVIAAAQAGKAIFCEKPMAMHVREADQMLAACRRARVPLTIGFVRQFDNEWGTMRKIVCSGRIGRPVIWQSMAGGPGPAAAWFNDARMGGGPLMDGAVHNYDFAISMFGRGTLVQAASYTWNPAHTAQDTATAIIRFAGGDELVMSWSWGMAQGSRANFFQQLLGPKGSIVWGAAPELLPKGFDPQTHGAFTLSLAGGKQRAVIYKKNNMFLDQMKHVVACFLAGRQPRVTGEHGRAALAVAESVLVAAARQKAVRVPR